MSAPPRRGAGDAKKGGAQVCAYLGKTIYKQQELGPLRQQVNPVHSAKIICLFRHALDIREHYERKLERANNLYMELNALMLQLELKERELLR